MFRKCTWEYNLVIYFKLNVYLCVQTSNKKYICLSNTLPKYIKSSSTKKLFIVLDFAGEKKCHIINVYIISI